MRNEDIARLAAESARYRVRAAPGWIDVFKAIRSIPEYHLLRVPLPAESLDGAYIRRAGRHYILVNSSYYRNHQRFTAAHELGHAFLEPDGDEVAHFERELTRHDDAAANRFAAYFLMDEQTVRTVAGAQGSPVAKCLAVMDSFEVSLEAAGIHLRSLGLISELERADVLRDRDEAGSLSRLARTINAKGPKNRPPDGATDPGDSYFNDLESLLRSGLLVPEQFDRMRSLVPTRGSA